MTTFNDATPITSGSVDIATPSVSIYGFTSIGAIEALYGQRGRENILEDLDNTTQDGDGFTEYDRVIRHFIRDAEQTMMSRLSPFFDAANMVSDSWVQSRTTWIAAHYISRRRGNEHYFEDLFNEAMRELDAIATGEIPPPANIPLNAYSMPSMSNVTIDNRFGIHKIRVKPTISVGGGYAGQDITFDHGSLYGWL